MRRTSGRIHRKAINTPGHAHELTWSCYQRYQFLRAERTCGWLAGAIGAARVRHAFDLWAFVFMPEHVHLIVCPRGPECDMQKVLAGIKLPMARRAVHFLEATNSPWLAKITRRRGKRTERPSLQSGCGNDRNIMCGKALPRMIDYLHNNPARRGLAERARDWKWSSAAWFEEGTSPIPLDPIPWEWLGDT